ncbi:MAG: ATP-dependent RecD-like DNA helicase [Anaeroplasmataceae bacterium]|nr:ATP-dependent RecD-like DNA helicase [Anaeroplasmataceae bacterium]
MSEVIKGTILSYIYKSEDSLYKVARINSNEEEIIIVGSFLELEEGLEYEFVGEYILHSKYGKQFKIESYTKSASFTEEGLISYLSSDKFFGIGTKLATNIVQTLGLDCIEKIMENPDCLDAVKQVTKSKKEVLVTVLKENYASEQVIIKLFSFGLTNKMIYRLYEVYGNESALRIEENPYCLIYDVEGYGFKKADSLALRLGLKENDKLRIKEALKYTLNAVCYQQGFTFLTKEQLINSAHILLKNSPLISISDLEYGLESLVIEHSVIQEENRYFEPVLYQAETATAERLLKIASQPCKLVDKEKMDPILNQVEKDLNIHYTDLQKEAIFKALTNKMTIITGGPGTGKSTIINGILKCYAASQNLVFPSDELDAKVVMMAPTGRAAKRMTEVTNFKAYTIHKVLGYHYEEGFVHKEDCPLTCSLVIIDECSMIDILLAKALFKALPLKCQIILVGDEFQLSSVGPGNVFHELIESGLFTTVKLFEIMRQAADSAIVRLASMIHAGKLDYRILSDKKEVFFYPCDAKNLKELLFRIIDSYVAAGNDLKTGMQILIPMYAGIAGIDSINEAISNRYNLSTEKLVKDDSVFKVEDKVLQLKNDPELELLNGDIGIIKGMMQVNQKDILIIDFDGRMVSYPVKESDNLRLAYAISIHKAQGSEYDHVIVPILPSYYMMLRKKIIYTAVTRAKKKLILVGDTKTLKEAVNTLEPMRQTALLGRLKNTSVVHILDATIPFDTLGEYDMEGITPYSFME